MLTLMMAALLVTGGTPQPAAAVSAGRAHWDSFPALRKTPRALPTSVMVSRVADLLQKKECDLPGQSHRRFDITVPYVVLVKPDGGAERVVVADMGCPALETYVGLVVLKLAGAGDFQPTGQKEPRWYSSALNFNVR